MTSGIDSGLPSGIASGIVSGMDTTEKTRENRLRRMAQRQGLQLARSRRRDPRAFDYGGYMLVDVASNAVVAGGSPLPYALDLAAVESYLTGETRD